MKIENYADYVANQNDITKLDFSDYSVNVKKYLSLSEAIAMVETVTEHCIDDETGAFHPEVIDFLIRNSVFTMYTDVELPEDIEERYDFVYRFGELYYNVVRIIDSEQFSAVTDAIKAKIKYIANANVEALNKNVQKLMDSAAVFGDGLSKSLEGLDKEELKNAINVLSGAMYDKTRGEMKTTTTLS